MKIIIGGETGWDWLERLAYDGVIGIFYKDTLSGVCAYLILAVLIIFALIGVVTVLKRILFGGRRRETAGKHWMRTGRMK